MNKKYSVPEIRVINVESVDIVTASPCDMNESGTDSPMPGESIDIS